MRRMRIFYIFFRFISPGFITVLPQGNDTFLPNVSPFIPLDLPSSVYFEPKMRGFPVVEVWVVRVLWQVASPASSASLNKFLLPQLTPSGWQMNVFQQRSTR